MKARTPCLPVVGLIEGTVSALAKATVISGTISKKCLVYSRCLMFLLPSLLVISPAFGQQVPKNTVSSQGWTVTAETPVSVGIDQIQGRVTFARSEGAETRGGGLCLVADLYGGFACESDSDCSSLPVPTGGFHYCAGVNGSKKKTCWTRPTAAGCVRSPANTPGTYTTDAVPLRVDGQFVKWIGIACMAVETNPRGCSSLDPSQSVHVASKLFADEQ